MGHVQVSRLISARPEDLYGYLTDLENLPEWLDPTLEAEPIEIPPTLREQSEFAIKFTRYGRSVDSTFRVDRMKRSEKFSYRQVTGFFKSWEHTQLLSPHDDKTTLLTDVVDFQMPYGILGALADDLFVSSDIKKLLQHRLMKIDERFLGPA